MLTNPYLLLGVVTVLCLIAAPMTLRVAYKDTQDRKARLAKSQAQARARQAHPSHKPVTKKQPA